MYELSTDGQFEDYKQLVRRNLRNSSTTDRIEAVLWIIVRLLFYLVYRKA